LSTDNPKPTADDEAATPAPDEAPSGATPADASVTPEGEASSQDETARTDAPADAAPEEPVEEAPAEEAPAEEAPAEEAPAEEPVAEVPVAEEQPADEPVAEAVPAPAEAAEKPVGETAAATGGQAPEEEFEPAARVKPEIPGADLEPVFVAQEEQYLDAEAQAAAEAEAEAEAERRRAEAEDEAAKPIADAAIDLAAGARYTATGKRKTAVARVILRPGAGTYSINGKPLEDFFPRDTLQRMIRQPLETVGYEARMDVVARMHGGGVAAQAGALRHGISRALIVADPNLRSELKRRGFLTRDPRVKERKKAGLKKARKRPQFSKR
jgi:small subunit ribosomal protein S9